MIFWRIALIESPLAGAVELPSFPDFFCTFYLYSEQKGARKTGFYPVFRAF